MSKVAQRTYSLNTKEALQHFALLIRSFRLEQKLSAQMVGDIALANWR